MTCAACQSFVQRTLEKTPGVREATVSLMLHNATVAFDEDATSPEALVQAIESVGYEAALPEQGGDEGREELARQEYRALRLKAGVSLAIGMIAMALPMHWMMHATVQYTLLVASLCVMMWAGRHFYVKAYSALRHGSADMNTLIALGTGSAFVYSTAATIHPAWFTRGGIQAEVYFEAVIFIIALMLVGKAIEAKAMARTVDALRKLVDLQPKTARVERDGAEMEVPIALLRVGDIVATRPGERIAADGEVLSGQSGVDESMLTGESLPVDKEPGSKLMGGTLNKSGLLRYHVTRVGEASTLAQIVRLLRDAQGSKAPIQKLADRVSLYFVPTVVAIAIVTFAAWLWLAPEAGVTRALTSAVAVLIIACPCAMGLAVPAAVMVATGRAADFGILIKGGEALERLSEIRVLLLDKTGTITAGKPAVTHIELLPRMSEEELLRLAASVEAGSEHPVAHAVVEAARARNLDWSTAAQFQIEPGMGARAEVDGKLVAIGNPTYMAKLGVDWKALEPAAAAAATKGQTPLYVAIDGKASGIIAVADTIRPTSPGAIRELQKMGLELVLLTGDNPATARAIADQAGIQTVLAGVLPEGKLEAVRQRQATGVAVAMAGDGINDAPALAQADVGIAMGAGADVAIESSDLTLMRNDVSSIVDAILLSRATLRTIRENLFWAFAYNVIGIPLAAGVLYPAFGLTLSPVFASAAMALSSVSVIGNSLRLLRFQHRKLN